MPLLTLWIITLWKNLVSFLDESRGEKGYFTDDAEIYLEKELEVVDKQNYIPTVHYADNHYMQTSTIDSV